MTTISRTRLAPDIDVLGIERPYNKEPSLAGYECKLLNRSRRALNPFYAGLGQVLCYFRYGLDHAWLVVGVPSELPPAVEGQLTEIFEFLREWQIIPRYVGLKSVREGRGYLREEVEPEGRFCASSAQTAKYMRDSLLREEFVCSRRFAP